MIGAQEHGSKGSKGLSQYL